MRLIIEINNGCTWDPSIRGDKRLRLIRRSVIFGHEGTGATNAAVPGILNGIYDGKSNCGGAQGCCVLRANAWYGRGQERGTGMSGGSGSAEVVSCGMR
jgi:hypothetical protein